MTHTAEAIAADIIRQHDGRVPFAPLSPEIRAMPGIGYAVQEHLISHWSKQHGPIAGWKVGLTSRRMQEMCGIGEPIAGAIFEERFHRSPTRLENTQFVRLGLEAELAVRIATVPDPDASGDADMFDHIDAVCAAFEIIEDRAADYAALDAVSLVADNSWNGGIALAQPVSTAGMTSLLDIRGELFRNDMLIETGLSQDAGGDPLAIMRWLAKGLRARGRSLEAGQWIMTGSIVRTQFPKPGEVYRFVLGQLPPVSVTIA